MERGREKDLGVFDAWKYQHFFEFDSVKSDKEHFYVQRKNSTSNLSKHRASWQRNVKLIEKPPDPPTDVTAAATNSIAKQGKIDLRATGVSFDSILYDGICRKNRIRLKGLLLYSVLWLCIMFLKSN